MSLTDTLAPLFSSPWLDSYGKPLALRPLPGLPSDNLRALKYTAAGLMHPEYREFLSVCSGLAGGALGHIDFTGCWYPVEVCPVFHPCLTLLIDDEGRRWMTEISEAGLPGRVWCLFTEPQVAVFVSEDLATFLPTLREKACNDCLLSWLEELSAQAHTVWTYRRDLALRPSEAVDSDAQVSAWLKTLPLDAYVYDLREPKAARGWPYGLIGPDARLFRCGSLPLFAIAAPYLDGSRLRDPETLLVPKSGPQAHSHWVPLPVAPHQWTVWRRRGVERAELQRCA